MSSFGAACAERWLLLSLLDFHQLFPLREEIITIGFAVVAFSVFIQGLTMIPFLRRMGEIPR